MNCLNCANEFQGQYCPDCGQPSRVRRLALVSILNDFLFAVLNTDRGLLKTSIDLFARPGEMLDNYLKGRRQIYMSAGKYTLLWVVIFTIMSSMVENHFGFFQTAVEKVDDMVGGNWTVAVNTEQGKEFAIKSESASTGGGRQEWLNKEVDIDMQVKGKHVQKKVTHQQLLNYLKFLIPRYHDTLFDTLNYLLFLWIPLAAFTSLLVFWRLGFNFAEHLTINSYLFAQVLCLSTLIMPFFWLLPQANGTTLLGILLSSLFYLVYSYMDIYKKATWRLFKVINSLGATLMAYMTTLFAILLFLSLKIAWDNIDAL